MKIEVFGMNKKPISFSDLGPNNVSCKCYEQKSKQISSKVCKVHTCSLLWNSIAQVFTEPLEQFHRLVFENGPLM